MKRRAFSAATLGVAALALPVMATAQARAPQDGKDYRTLGKQLPVEAPAGKIEVVEFFWYKCPHCNAFEPRLVDWIRRAPPDVVVRRIPVAFRDDFVPQQRLFYALEAVGQLEALHQKVFDAIHRGNTPLNREEEIARFVEANGVDRAGFLEHYRSFAVSAKARRAAELQDAYGVAGVPAIGVGGRFYTDGELAGNNDRVLSVVDYLVAQARKPR